MRPAPRSASHSVHGPTGAGWIDVQCSNDQGSCYEKAGHLCPDGYDLASSDGSTEVHGSVSKGSGSISSQYTGHMLIKCTNSSMPWKPVYGPRCRFRIPPDWQGDTIEGRKVFHVAGAYGSYAFLDVHPFTGTLASYPTADIADGKVEEVEIDGHDALFATRVDQANGAMLATVVAIDHGQAYELTCASPTSDAVSPLCRKILASLTLGPNPIEP